MRWQFTLGGGVLFVTTALSLVLAAALWERNRREVGWLFPVVMLAVAEWCFAAGLEASSAELGWKVFWSTLEYVGNGSTAALFLLFAAQRTGRAKWLHDGRRHAVWLLPVGGFALAASNKWHHAVWTSFTPGPPGSNVIIYAHGIGYFVVAAVIYVYILSGCALLVLPTMRPTRRPHREVVTILVASAFPIAAGVLYSVGLDPIPGLNLVPVSFFFTIIVFLVGMRFFRVFHLVPVARGAIVEEMSDAVLVVDAERRIVDANPAAARWFVGSVPLVGRPILEVFAPWPRLCLLCQEQAGRVELTLHEEPLLHVDVRVTPVRESANRPAGYFVVMHDMTERYMAQLTLVRANERLEEHVRRIEALQNELRNQAIRDALTGLFNRRYLDEILPRDLSRASQEGGIVSVVMVDIDHFKETNDLRGHREGDRLLSLLGQLLRERTRPNDTACRYGGEEFLLVLPGATPAVARDRMQEIRAEYSVRLRAQGFAHPPTLSAGVAAFPEHAQSDDELLQAADRALYRAKAEGRDRVCVAEA